MLLGISKGTVVKCLKEGYRLRNLGHLNAKQSDLYSEAITFIAACYKLREMKSMSAVWCKVRSKKMANKRITAAPNLKSLPPTTEAFEEHVLRVHVQSAIWLSVLEVEAPVFEHSHDGQ